MKILLVNKYYYLRSGTERYLFNLKQLLETEGHLVEVFSMYHPLNVPATYSEFFVPAIDFPNASFRDKLASVSRVIWSPGAAARFGRVLDHFRPDIIHLFNIYHHLSPSILQQIGRRGIPTVQTLNDYKLICPNYLLYVDEKPCIRCRGKKWYFPVLFHRCLHGSLAWSALAALEMSLHKAWRIYERNVVIFIAPSEFVRTIALDFGVPSSQLTHIPYFLFPELEPLPPEDRGYIAYVGRLSREKGLLTLLSAVEQLPSVELLIVGEGPVRHRLEREIKNRNLSNVRLAGYLGGRDLKRAVAGSRFTVLPSEWFEVFGQTILESFVAAKPVVATRIGGIPEVINDKEDGLLVEPANSDALTEAIRWLWDRPEEARSMGAAGKAKVEGRYGAESHYQLIQTLYREILDTKP